METLPYVIVAVGVSFLAIVAAIRFTLIHHEVRNKVAVLIILGSVVWLLMSALGLASDSLPTKLVFFKLQFVGVLIVPTTWLINTMQFSGYERWIKRSNLVALSAVPVITLLLIFTNPHGLMWSNLALNPIDPFLPLFESRGVGYWLLIVGDAYVVLMLTLMIFVRKMMASRSLYRRQAVPMIFVSCVPWTLSVVWFLNPSLFMYIDPTALGLTVATSILFWRLADLPGAGVAPVAHELIFDSMNEAVIILDAQTRIVELNPRAQQLVGHNLSDAIGKPVDRVWAGWADVKKELDFGTERVREVSFGVGEEKKVYEMQISYLSGIMSELPNLLIILRDITERKILDEKLRVYSKHLEELVSERTRKLAESERRFRELADLLPQIVFETDEKGMLTFFNRVGLSLSGYTEEDLQRGFDAFQALPPEDARRASEVMRRVMKGEQSGPNEYSLLRKDGTSIPVLIYSSAIIRDGKAVGLRGIIVDITERKLMESQLVEAQRLAAIGETTTMVGHDLRNPLQAMTSALYLVKKLMASERAEDKKEAVGLLSTFNDTIRYMDKIVSDLQAYARPVGADMVEASLPDLVNATVSSVKIPENVQVTLDIHDSSSNLRLDPALFKRVLTNLILNAVQAMPNGGKLTIAASSGDESITVAVQDTGVGIASENLEKIFNPFFTTKSQGQGLGLAVCKRLIDGQGGTIEVTSQVGKGSAFTFKIPTNRKTET